MKCHAGAVVGSSLVLVLVLLQRSPVVFSAPHVSPFVSRLGQEVGDLLAPCLAPNASGPWDCLKGESLASVERLARAPRIPLLAGVSLVRASVDALEPREAKQGTRSELAWRRSVLGSLRRLLHSHILEIDLGPECDDRRGTPWPRQLLTVRFGDQELSTHAPARPEGRHRRRQQMIPMMIFGVTVFGMFIVPIAFQFLTALSGKAFLMAKLALLLASINGLKRVASTGVHYGLYHAVDQFPAGPHHMPPPLHHPFGAGPMLYERTDGLGYAEGPRVG
uniref:Uncharacterized protein n=1 Tax=Anopheles atroparvus TaxID=41427 RepID=A0A182JF03_ANOAO